MSHFACSETIKKQNCASRQLFEVGYYRKTSKFMLHCSCWLEIGGRACLNEQLLYGIVKSVSSCNGAGHNLPDGQMKK